MPFVSVKLIEGVFTLTQKREIIHRVTDTLVSIEGENLRPLTCVVIDEVKRGDWGVGGHSLTTEDAKAMVSDYAKG